MSDQDDIFAAFRTEAESEPEPKAKKFKKDTARVESEPEATGDDEEYLLPALRPEYYTAFRLGKRRERLIIVRAAQPMRFPAYHELRDINFDQAYQQGFNLFFYAMTVEVMGENLWPVVHAIASGRCEAIYEYHAKLYSAPPDKGEPFITSIKIEPPTALADES